MGKEPKRKKEKEKKKTPLKKVLLVIWLVLAAALTVAIIYLYPILKNMNISSVAEKPETTLNPPEVLEETEEVSSDLPEAQPMPANTTEPNIEMKNNEDYGIVNIMLFGMDNRYKKTILGGRSDVNIIMTLDTKNNEVRMTSIMRDTLIYIPAKEDYNRINTAIVYEDGPEGAIAAIEQEFHVDIDHYIITSFRGMAEIIDTIGGVDATLSQQEVWDMNGLIQEMNLIFGNRSTKYFVQNPGTTHLNGIQAVAYMRIRKTGGVFERDARQKEILASAKENLKDMTLTELDTAVRTVSDWVKTDLQPAEFVALAMQLYEMRNASLKASRVPYDGMYEAVRYKEMAVLQYDKEPNLYKMHDFIYNGIE